MFEKQVKRILALCPGAFAIMVMDTPDGGWNGRILDDHYRPISGAWPESRFVPTLEALYNELEAAARRVATENFNDRFIQEGMVEHSQGDVGF